jgi:orotidine-5'-phosphate decarboxylase
LCLGIDPHPYLLAEWGLPDSADGVLDFGLRAVEAAVDRVGIVKPQVAFFERHGSTGYAALEKVIARARGGGVLVIADAKRGDLGSSVEAYGQAWLSPGGALESDAMTVSAFQGVGSIARPIALARESGKGLFVLAATSNPEGESVQTARIRGGEHEGRSVAAEIVSEVVNANAADAAPLGSLGLVLGATVSAKQYGIDLESLLGPPATPVLAPGFGHQGAQFSDIRPLYGEVMANVIVSASRSVLKAGPQGIADAIARTAGELAECLA